MQSLLGDQSAVSQMLELLVQHPPAGQPGQPVPPPAAPMPNVQTRPTPIGQINAGMMAPQAPQNMLGMLHDFVQNKMAGGVPAEYSSSGILSPQELESAKPGIMQVLSRGGAYRANLDRVLEMKGVAEKMGEMRRIKGVRQTMEKMFEPKGEETHAETMARLEKMFAYVSLHGDSETADRLKGVVAEMAIPQRGMSEAPHTISTKAGIMQWDPVAKKFTATGMQAPDRAEPQPSIVSAAMPNADGSPGTPTYFRVPKDGGPATPIEGIVPHPGSSAQNAQNMAAEALLRSSVSEMTNADQFMKSYEGDLASGKKSINGLAQFMAGVGNSFTHDDPASRAAQNAALFVLNHQNPDLARYIRRGLSFAEGEAGISKRPSDFRTKMAAFLSTAASGASPDMISDIQGRRNSILQPLHSVLADHAKGPTSSGPSKPKLTQAQYDAGRAKGHSQAEIASHYDLTGITAK